MTETHLRTLLSKALDCVYVHCIETIELSSAVEKIGDVYIPVAGTCDEDAADYVKPLLDLIRQVESAGVFPLSAQPGWMIDIVRHSRPL